MYLNRSDNVLVEIHTTYLNRSINAFIEIHTTYLSRSDDIIVEIHVSFLNNLNDMLVFEQLVCSAIFNVFEPVNQRLRRNSYDVFTSVELSFYHDFL